MPPEPENDGIVYRQDGLHIRGLREESREADFVASTDTIDSWDEIVEQKWRLDRYLKNPVALYAHNSRDLPIGQATRVEMVDGNLECTIKFVTEEANPLAQKVWLLLKQKALRAVSVGFWPNEYRWEMREGREVLVLSDNELREISVVPVPANPDALAKMKAKAMAAKTNASVNAAKENDMDPKELQARADKLEADVKTAEKAVEQANTKIVALEAQNSRLVTERDAAIKDRDAAVSSLVDKEVGELVGKKIAASEKEAFVELARKDRPLFDKMVAQRSDMMLTTPKLPETPEPLEKSVTGEDDLSDILAKATA